MSPKSSQLTRLSQLSSGLVAGVLGLLMIMVIAGCGGSAALNDSIGRLTPPGTELPFNAGPGSAAVSPVVPIVPGGAGAPGAAPVESRAFCQDLRQLQTLVLSLFQASGSAAAVSRAQALVARISADAPAELRPAVQELAETARRLSADLGSSPPNVADAARVLTDPAYQQALQRLVGYAAAHC
ncbi:MAG: hypothetical protein QOF30_1545 [Acidimicrobiaceae bacterium]|nr:hypothetical protein [Acidimicrobiaceae bacterium]